MVTSILNKLLEEKLRSEILNFLKRDPHIGKINFSFQGYIVSPFCYRVDIRKAIENHDIEIKAKQLSGRVVAKYWDDVLFWDDEITLSTKFNISNPVDQSYLIHECTHAHLDYRNLGQMQTVLNEAICYTAQHVWLKAAVNANPRVAIPQGITHAAAHNIAKQILGGKINQYIVNPQLAKALMEAIRSDPNNVDLPKTLPSDGV